MSYQYYTVYKITILETNQYYIGVHATNNLNDDYMGSGGRKFKNAIKNAKNNNFSIKKEILKLCNSYQESLDMEKTLINYDIIENDILCLNTIEGGGINTQIGKVRTINENNEIVIVDKEKFLTDDLKSWNKNKTTAYNTITKKEEHVDKNDIRWSTGELVGINKNKVYIHNKLLDKRKLVNKNKLEKYLNEGWELGTGIEKNAFNKNKIVIKKKNNKNLYINEIELEKYLNEGWELGMNKKDSSHKGSKWLNDGKINKMIQNDKIDEYLTLGWKYGRIK